MKLKDTLALAATAMLMCYSSVGLAGKAKPAKVCLIAGWENPASVCVAHTKIIAATCFNCHGSNGKSSTAIPSLAGQDKEYFVTVMKEFRDNKRDATVMRKYALGYTDDEYEAMGEFFAKVK